MVKIYTGSNSTMSVGRIQDFNNTNPSKGVAAYRNLNSSNPKSFTPYDMTQKVDFATAIYGNGPYSLSCPNVTSETLAKSFDVIA